MRVTLKLTYDKYINDMMRRQESIYGINKQLSTMKRVNAPSDDPSAAHRILSSKSLLSRFGQYERNIGSALTELGVAEQALDRTKEVIIRLQELAVTASSGTANDETMSSVKAEVDNLYQELVSLGNTSYDGRYIFSGYKTGTAAFDQSGNYQGDSNVKAVAVGASGTVATGVNGGAVFSGIGGGTDIMAAVAALSAALGAGDKDGASSAIDSLGSAFSQVSNAVSDIGGKVSRLNAASSGISAFKLDLESTISGLEDADLTRLITDLKAGEVALEAALASAGQVFNLSIFDYI